MVSLTEMPSQLPKTDKLWRETLGLAMISKPKVLGCANTAVQID